MRTFKVRDVSPKENLLLSIHHQEGEYVPREDEIRTNYNSDPVIRRIYCKGTVLQPPGGTDSWGVQWEGTRKDMVCFPVKHPLTEILHVNEFLFPDPEKEFQIADSDLEFLKSAKREKCLVMGCQPYFLFERAWALMGMSNFLVSLIRNPDRVSVLIEKIADFHIGIAERFVDLGVDCVWFTEDLGHQHGLMMNPATWRKIFKPHAKRVINVYKKNGKIVFFHSCGHVLPIIEDLIDLEVDVLHPLQARANNLSKLGSEIKKKYGENITFYGCVDSHLLITGRPNEVVEEAKTRIGQFANGGGYIFAPDQVLPYPENNITALWATAKEYGRYPLKEWLYGT